MPNEMAAMVPLEQGLEQLAELMDKWGEEAEHASQMTTGNPISAKVVLRAKCETWHEAARYVRKVLDESRPQPRDFFPSGAWAPEHYEHVEDDEIADRSVFQ
jgi:hypothetical protein